MDVMDAIRTDPSSGDADRDDAGIHLAIDLSRGSAITWAVAELAVALADIGRAVSVPPGPLAASIEPRLRDRLLVLARGTPRRTCHVRFNHYWPHLLRQEVWGEVDAELFVTNYRFRPGSRPLDAWNRTLVLDGVRKLALSGFCRDALLDVGVPAERCAVVPPGHAPEIEELFAAPRRPAAGRDRKLLVVTNSHDLPRYGTDLLVPALARALHRDDPVEIHLKDYGASSGSTELRNLVAAHPSLPRVVWHEEFLAKPDLLRLYGSMDLLVCPFRGEGYAMKIVDAMAIGLPVMMPAFGGPLEYAVPGGFLELPHDEVPLGRCYDTDHFTVGPGAWWCEVRPDGLVAALAAYVRDPSAAEAAAEVARRHVFGRFTWRNAALAMAATLDRWHAERGQAVARRRRPATLPLSVVIPTLDRPHELARTLLGYAAQTDREFEIVLVNDHGDHDAVRAAVAPLERDLRLRVVDNQGRPGPAAARNVGIELAEGGVLLVTGDDIVPAPTLVERHRRAHHQRPEVEAAFLGRIEWHPEVPLDWVARHVVGAGGQQFNAQGLVPGELVRWDRFVTANVSWKRELTAGIERLFCEDFRLAAWEDVELGARLDARGMQLRYLADAVGFHLHAMPLRWFLGRMRRVGAMAAVFASAAPGRVPGSWPALFESLERERRRRETAAAEGVAVSLTTADDLLEPWIRRLESLLATSTADEESGPAEILRCMLFDNLCDALVRVGMADEWARGSVAEAWAGGWVAAAAAAALAGPPAVDHTARGGLRRRLKELLSSWEPAARFRQWLRQRRQARRLHREVRDASRPRR